MTSEIEATAKATQEVAKTTGKAIDAASGIGKFLERVFGPALEEAGAMLHDRVSFRRGVNLLRLQSRFEQIRREHGIVSPVHPLGLKAGVPLIEAASLEEDDTLHEMFANLLVNYTSPASGTEQRRAYVSILQDMTPLDARLLLALYHAPSKDTSKREKTVKTTRLPESYATPEEESDNSFRDPAPDVQIALWNLARLGCVEPATGWGGVSSVSHVTLTSLGIALVEACQVGGFGSHL